MPSKKFATTWSADQHTIAKITLLKAYLGAWFQIMGRGSNAREKDIIYIDGFAGPGEYTNYRKGSPIAALEAAIAAASTEAWNGGNIHCVFIEPDLKRINNLRGVIANIPDTPKRVQVHFLQHEFVKGLDTLRSKELPNAFTNQSPLFVFLDPFGATGAPFSAVEKILSSPFSEILINLDTDGIARILNAEDSANADTLLRKVFNSDEWRSARNLPFQKQCSYLLELYIGGLKRLPNVKYVFSFEMRSKTGSLNYHLVFASQHFKGLEKMKEAMKRVDQDGSYCFSDANADMLTLFRFDNPEDFSNKLFETFRGKSASYEQVRDYALNETPFVNPKKMLKDLEDKKLIMVESRKERRRRGTFAETDIKCIKFEGGG